MISTAASKKASPLDTGDDVSAGGKTRWNWEDHFGRPVNKDHPIWERYVEVAVAHDNDVIEAVSRSMDILLVFSGLFSAVVTTFIVQTEQDLRYLDPADYIAKVLGAVFRNQIIAIREALYLDLLTTDEFVSEDKSPEIAVIPWYISLDFALLVAGGAVCMKQWLLEYRRSNNSQQVPYERAIHHQQSYAGLIRWFVPQFGDLLGTILLLDLVPFFAGFLFHLSKERTGNWMFWDVSCVVLGVYSAFLGFTIIVGMVPTSPYKSPISNLFMHIPRSVYSSVKESLWYTRVMAVVFVTAMVVISVVYVKTTDIDRWFILLWILPMFLAIGSGLRNALKVGRIAWRIPVVGFAIGTLTCATLGIALAPEYSEMEYDPSPAIYLTYLPSTFVLVVSALTTHFAGGNRHRDFPAGALILAAIGIVVALLVSWNLGGYSGGYEQHDWAIPLGAAIAWLSMMNLNAKALLNEGAAQEDSRETEALGWLIAQARDTQVLHSALACIPSVANTPFRRHVMLHYTRQTLTSLINSLVGVPDRRRLVGTSNITPDNNGSLDCESRLKFYITCLAETSHMSEEKRIDSTYTPGVRRTSRPSRGWVYNNWYRFLTIPPSSDLFTRELRILHHSHLSLPSPPLRDNLHILSTHNDLYLSVVSQAALYQLYHTSYLIESVLTSPKLRRNYSEKMDFCSSHAMLVEIRMITTHVIDLGFRFKVMEPSVLRYLYCYCYNAMKIWTSRKGSQGESVFEMTMVLSFLIMENDSRITSVTSLGDSTPMKAARCIMALKRWHDRNKGCDNAAAAMDTELHDSFALSIVSAIAMYLRLAAEAPQEDRLIQLEEAVYTEEYSVSTGMKYLENSLLQVLEKEWPVDFVNHITSALESFYSIIQESTIELLPLDAQYDAALLMKRLKDRAAKANASARDRVSSIRAASKILNKVPNRSTAWSLAVDDSSSLPDIIRSMAREESIECRVAALSTLLDTQIFDPRITGLHGKAPEEPTESDPSHLSTSTSTASYVIVEFTGETDLSLIKLYDSVMNDSCPLFLSTSVTDGWIDHTLIDKIVTISSLLADNLPPEAMPSAFFQKGKYPKALAMIAKHDDEELIPAPTRGSAVLLFARLWTLSYQRNSKGVEEKEINGDDIFWKGTQLAEIAKGLEILVDSHASIELETISLWIERLEAISGNNVAAKVVSESGLVKAFCGLVGRTGFGKPIEELRRKVFDELIALREKLPSSDGI